MAVMTLNRAERRELISALVTNCAGWDQDDIDLLVNMSSQKLVTHARGCADLLALNEGEIDDSGLPDTLEPSSAQELESSATDEGWDEEEPSDGDQGDNLAPEMEKVEDQPKKCHDEEGNEIACPDESGDSTPEATNVTENQWLRFAPPRIRSVVVNAMRFEHAQKQQLVTRITTNRRNRFSSNYLMQMPLDELQALADLASPRSNYIGAAGGPTLNEESVDRGDILTIPTLEFIRS